MKAQLSTARRIIYYQLLLQRYAMRLLHEEVTAALVVQEVLDAQYAIDGLAQSMQLRKILKTDVYNRCFYRQQSKIFNRPPAKVPRRKYETSSSQTIYGRQEK
jgi:hypothetical protein